MTDDAQLLEHALRQAKHEVEAERFRLLVETEKAKLIQASVKKPWRHQLAAWLLRP